MAYTRRVKMWHGGGRVTWEDADSTAVLTLWLDEFCGVRRAGIDYPPKKPCELNDDDLDRARQAAAYLRDDAEALAEAVANGEAWERDGALPEE